MRKIGKTILTVSTLGTIIGGIGPLASSSVASTPNQTYEHGLYAQAHWGSQTECTNARTSVLNVLDRFKATNISAGLCHNIAATDNNIKKNGWVYDVTYQYSKPIWLSDKNLGNTNSNTLAQHSFKVTGSYADKNSASNIEAARYTQLNNNANGMKVTWRSGVTQNPSGKWVYEIDYNSRVPLYESHTEISENPNVTTPSLIVVSNNPSTTVTAPSNGTVTTGTTKSTNTGTVITTNTNEPVGVQGIDISAHTTVNDWAGWTAAGVKFLYIKATEGTYYKNPSFSAQYSGATKAGIIRGAYHFGTPSLSSSGASQADYLIANGGGWSADGQTLPAALDMEWNPYGATCYSLTQNQMKAWTDSFVNEYHAKTGVYPTIYTAKEWWNQCVGTNYSTPATLWVASWKTTIGQLPGTWSKQLIWQNSDGNGKGYDTDIYTGTLTQLKKYALTGVMQ